jgi:hypothetical protein
VQVWDEPLATGWISGLEWAAEWQWVLQLQLASLSLSLLVLQSQLPLQSL